MSFEFATYHVACECNAANNKKELMHGCLIIRSSLLYWPLPGVYYFTSSIRDNLQFRPVQMHKACTDWWKCTWRGIRIFCIWGTCTIPKARRYNGITADGTGGTKQLVRIRLFAYSIYLVFTRSFKIIYPLSSTLHYCLHNRVIM